VTIFWLEMAEMVRRWMWVFLRVEWEVVRMTDGRQIRSMSDENRLRYEEEEFELLAPAEDDAG
jgi:hypothetical protein